MLTNFAKPIHCKQDVLSIFHSYAFRIPLHIYIQPLNFIWKHLNRKLTHTHVTQKTLSQMKLNYQNNSSLWTDLPDQWMMEERVKNLAKLFPHIAWLFVKTTNTRPCTHTCLDKIPPNTPAHLQYYYNTRRSVEKEPDYIMHLTTSHYNKEQVSSRTPRHLSTSSGWHA